MQLNKKSQKMNAEEYFQTANQLKQENKLEMAIDAYRLAFEIEPQIAKYSQALGNSLAKLGSLDEAISYYNHAINLKPEWHQPYHSLGKIFEKQGESKMAIANYEKTIELNPNFSWSYFSLANILTQKGLLDEAIKYYRNGIQVHSSRDSLPLFYIKLGELLAKQEKLDEAISNYHTAIKLGSTRFADYYQIGMLYKQQQNFSEAINYLVKALQYSPGHIITYYEIADILEKQGLFSESSFCYDRRNLPINIINKYYQSVNNWSVINSNNFVYQSVHPPSKVSLIRPKAFDDNIHDSVNKTEASTRETFTVSLQDGRGWSDGRVSAIITSDNQVLADVSTGGFHIVAASKNAEATHKIDGVVAFLSAHKSSVPNYCHWMFDVLPRIELLRLSGIDINSIDKFVLHKCSERNFQKETLSCLGIDRTKIIDSYQKPYIRASQLLIPSILAHPCNSGGKWAVEFLRKSFLKESTTVPHGKQKKRLYISRKSASKRRIINEEVILEILNKYGFETVVMDSLSVIEQASLLANAEAVISAHGANLTNIVFCNSGTKVIEIFSPMYGTSTYFTISNSCNLEYYNLIGKDFDNSQATMTTTKVPNSYWGKKDIYVDKNDLLKLLKFAGLT